MTKKQTPAQRVANPVWLRGEIETLIKHCADNIEFDQEIASSSSNSGLQHGYEQRVEAHRYWKRQLERLLRGKTVSEDLRDFLQRAGVAR